MADDAKKGGSAIGSLVSVAGIIGLGITAARWAQESYQNYKWNEVNISNPQGGAFANIAIAGEFVEDWVGQSFFWGLAFSAAVVPIACCAICCVTGASDGLSANDIESDSNKSEKFGSWLPSLNRFISKQKPTNDVDTVSVEMTSPRRCQA